MSGSSARSGRSEAYRYYCQADGTELAYSGYYHCPACGAIVDVKDLVSRKAVP